MVKVIILAFLTSTLLAQEPERDKVIAGAELAFAV